MAGQQVRRYAWALPKLASAAGVRLSNEGEMLETSQGLCFVKWAPDTRWDHLMRVIAAVPCYFELRRAVGEGIWVATVGRVALRRLDPHEATIEALISHLGLTPL